MRRGCATKAGRLNLSKHQKIYTIKAFGKTHMLVLNLVASNGAKEHGGKTKCNF